MTLQGKITSLLKSTLSPVYFAPEYKYKWKEWPIGGGDPIPALRATANKEAKLIGWPSPVVPNGGRRPKGGSMSPTGQTPDGKKRQVDVDFIARSMAGWASPTTRDWKDSPGMAMESVNPDGSKRDRNDLLPRQVYELVGWNIPDTGISANGHGRRGSGSGSTKQSERDIEATCKKIADWVTPRQQDHKHANATEYELNREDGKDLLHVQVARTNSGVTTDSSDQTHAGVSAGLDPRLPCWLQGYPEAHHGQSPGWKSTMLVRKMLSGLPLPPEDIATALSRDMETQL